MTDCFDLLPQWARRRLSALPEHKDWMQCNSCLGYQDVVPLKKCAGCSKYRVAPIYYCSQECQKADWANHKIDCQKSKETANLKIKFPSTPIDPKEHAAFQKRLHHWMGINTQTVTWSILHAYHFNPSMDPDEVVFDFHLDPYTFQITSFEFLLKTDPECQGFFSRDHLTELKYQDKFWYRFRVDRSPTGPPLFCYSMNFIDFSPEERDCLKHIPGGAFVEWPWIAKHLTRTIAPSGWVAMRKWELLISAVHKTRRGYKGSLDRFTAPEFKPGVPFIPEDMELWYDAVAKRDIWRSIVDQGFLQIAFNREDYRPQRRRAILPPP